MIESGLHFGCITTWAWGLLKWFPATSICLLNDFAFDVMHKKNSAKSHPLHCCFSVSETAASEPLPLVRNVKVDSASTLHVGFVKHFDTGRILVQGGSGLAHIPAATPQARLQAAAHVPATVFSNNDRD